ncbi:MAG: hypothetical protein IH987_16475, partial [Planctomycetes bacterium]|nr:hypothetical protein [Planctomycetota bacterium]
MRIRLGVFVGCMFLVHSSSAEDGKTAVVMSQAATMTAIGTPAAQPPLTVRHVPAREVDESRGVQRQTNDVRPEVTYGASRGRGGVNDPQPVDPGSPNDRRKNRYISFKPNNMGGQAVRLEVTLTGSLPHPALVGNTWWVQAPVAPGNPLLPAGECVAPAGAQATAADIDWIASGCTVLHVTGCPIEPTSDYDVRAVAGANVSNALAVSTILKPGPKFWGDTVGSFDGLQWTPPDLITNIDDAVAIIKTWLGGPVVAPVGGVAHLTVADVDPGNINLLVNISDLFQVILAFQGNPYPFGPADPDGGCADDPGVNAPGAEIRFFPIRTAPFGSPPGTLGDPVTPQFNDKLGCWEVIVPEGVEVDLDLQAFGWGTAAGSPSLGAIQATVVSAGYDNGPASNLNPKGWPGSPGDGAYQARKTCQLGGDGSPCTGPFDPSCNGGANGFCIQNPDWVMPACASDLAGIATPTLDYGWGTIAQNGCAIDDGSVKTMGGLILEVPVGVAGTYVIGLDPDPNSTFMTSGLGTPITGITLTPACIVIPNAPVPEDSLGIPCTKTSDCRIDSPTPVCLSGRCYVHKNRSLAIVPNNPGRATVKFKVTLVDSLIRPCAVGDSWWAQAPLVPANDRPIPKLRPGECIAQLGPESTAADIDWGAAGCQKLYLVGCPLMPTSIYSVQSVTGSIESSA